MARTRSVVLIEMANITSAFQAIKSSMGLNPRSRLDLDKLVNAVTIGSEVVSKTVYTETRKPADDGPQKKFFDFFKIKGFAVVTKELKVIQLSNGDTKNKANFDVEMTTDICSHVWRRDCNEVVIVSGDSDFAYLVDKIRDLDVKVTIVSTSKTISKELRDRADRLILLDTLNLKDLTFTKEEAA